MNLAHNFTALIGLLCAFGTLALPIERLENSELELDTAEFDGDTNNDAALNASPFARLRRHHRRHHRPADDAGEPDLPMTSNTGQAYPGNLVYTSTGISYNIPYIYRPADVQANGQPLDQQLQNVAPQAQVEEAVPEKPREVPGAEFLKRVDSIADSMHKFYASEHNDNEMFKIEGGMDSIAKLSGGVKTPLADKKSVPAVTLHQIKNPVQGEGLKGVASSPSVTGGGEPRPQVNALPTMLGVKTIQNRAADVGGKDKSNLDYYVKYLGKEKLRPIRQYPSPDRAAQNTGPVVSASRGTGDNLVAIPSAYFYHGDSVDVQQLLGPGDVNQASSVDDNSNGADLHHGAHRDDYKAMPAYILMPPLECPASCACHENKEHVDGVKGSPLGIGNGVHGSANKDAGVGGQREDVVDKQAASRASRSAGNDGIRNETSSLAEAGMPVEVVTGICRSARARRSADSVRPKRTTQTKESKEVDDFRSLHDRLEAFSANMKNPMFDKQKVAPSHQTAKPKAEVQPEEAKEEDDVEKPEVEASAKATQQKVAPKVKPNPTKQQVIEVKKENEPDVVEETPVEETHVGEPEMLEANKLEEPALDSGAPEAVQERKINKLEEVQEPSVVQVDADQQVADFSQPEESAASEVNPVKKSVAENPAQTCMNKLQNLKEKLSHRTASAQDEQRVMEVLSECVEAMRDEDDRQEDGGPSKRKSPDCKTMPPCTEETTTPDTPPTEHPTRMTCSIAHCGVDASTPGIVNFDHDPFNIDDYMRQMRINSTKRVQDGDFEDQSLSINELPEDLQRELVKLENAYQYKVFPGCNVNSPSCKAKGMIDRLNQRFDKEKLDQEAEEFTKDKKYRKMKTRKYKSIDTPECKTRQIHKNIEQPKTQDEEESVQCLECCPKVDELSPQCSEWKAPQSDETPAEEVKFDDAVDSGNESDVNPALGDASSESRDAEDKPFFPDLNMNGLPRSLVEDLSNLRRVIALPCPECSTRTPNRYATKKRMAGRL